MNNFWLILKPTSGWTNRAVVDVNGGGSYLCTEMQVRKKMEQ